MRTTLYPMLACEGEHILEKSIGYMLSESCTGCYTMDCDGSRHPVFGFIPQSLYLSLLKSGNKCDFIELKNYRENKGYTKKNNDVYCLFFSITHITTEYLQTGIESMYYLFRNHNKKYGIVGRLSKWFNTIMISLAQLLGVSEEYIKSNLILYKNEPKIIRKVEYVTTYYFALRMPLSFYLSIITPDDFKLRITRI